MRVSSTTQLVSRVADSLAISCEGGEDLIGGLDPHVRARVLVPDGDPVADVFLEGGNAGVGSPLDLLGGQFREPPFHHVQPRPRGGREMEMEAGMAQQPAMHVGVLWVA